MIPDHFGRPRIADSAFVAETAVIIGDVEVAEGASVWYGAVLRGDIGRIYVGVRSNVQDNCVVHNGPGEDVYIGEDVTVGHGAILHGCRIGDRCLIGMGAVVLSKAEIGEGCIVGAGAVVKEGDKIPPGSLVVGVPAKVVKQLTEEQMRFPVGNAIEYYNLSMKYLEARRR